MLTINIENHMKKHIHNGDLRNCDEYLALIPVKEMRKLFNFLKNNDVKSINGKKLLFRTGMIDENFNTISNWCCIHVEDVPSTDGFPKYSIYKSIFFDKKYLKFQLKFMEIDICAFAEFSENNERDTIIDNICQQIQNDSANWEKIDTRMQKIATSTAPKMSHLESMVISELFADNETSKAMRLKFININPDKEYDFRQLICAIHPAIVSYTRIRAYIGKLTELIKSKDISWDGFEMPNLSESHSDSQAAPECWFCPKESWQGCPSRDGKHENDGNFTINDMVEKYRERYNILKNRTNGIATNANGKVESFSFEYQIFIEYSESSNENSSSGGVKPIGLYVPAKLTPIAWSFNSHFIDIENTNANSGIYKKYKNFVTELEDQIKATPKIKEFLAENPKNRVSFYNAQGILNIKLSGYDKIISLSAADIYNYVPKIGDKIDIVFYDSESLDFKTAKVLKFETSTGYSYTKIKARKDCQEAFTKFTTSFHQENETKFKEYLLKRTGRQENQFLNQHYRAGK